MALPADPLIRGSGEDRRTTADLRRAPPSKEARTCTKSTTGDPTSSMAPPVEDLTNPTLSTPVKRGSPALPPPERPTENEGSGETTARRWICGRGEKSPLSTVAGERRRPGEKLKKLVEEKGIIIRFMIGHSHAANNALDKAIEVEDAIHHDFLRLDHVEGYHKLTAKNKTFFSTVVASWDADFYIKVDDDIHVNLGHDGIRLIRN